MAVSIVLDKNAILAKYREWNREWWFDMVFWFVLIALGLALFRSHLIAATAVFAVAFMCGARAFYVVVFKLIPLRYLADAVDRSAKH